MLATVDNNNSKNKNRVQSKCIMGQSLSIPIIDPHDTRPEHRSECVDESGRVDQRKRRQYRERQDEEEDNAVLNMQFALFSSDCDSGSLHNNNHEQAPKVKKRRKKKKVVMYTDDDGAVKRMPPKLTRW